MKITANSVKKKILAFIYISSITLIITVLAVLYGIRNFDLMKEGILDSFPSEKYVELPYETISSGHLIIYVRHQNRNLPFILDSGASNIIFSNQRDQINLGSYKGPNIGLGSTNKIFFYQIYKIDSLEIQSMKFIDLSFEVVDSQFFKCNNEIVGIIGKETMRHLVWQFRPKDKKILISNKIENLPHPPETIEIKLTKNRFSNHLYVPLAIQESKVYRQLIVDTGSNGGIHFEVDSIFLNENKSSLLRSFGTGSRGLVGENSSKNHHYFTDDIRLGSSSFSENIIQCRTSTSTVNTLGLRFLNQYNYTIDWSKNLLLLDPLTNQNFTRKGFGVSIKYNEESGEVLTNAIIENSVPHKEGLLPNIKVTSINGLLMNTIENYYSFKRQKDYDSLFVQTEEKGQVIEYAFTKENYLIYLSK